MDIRRKTAHNLGNNFDIAEALRIGPILLTNRGRPYAVIVALPALSLAGIEELAEVAQAEVNKRAGCTCQWSSAA